ncbi:MAG: hypothetical protein HQL28_05985, partial [Candidatus Omnitrophica bacterium]|nr:hypothetical protein [Candidatus Omnitrophota bacterium]
KATGDIFAWINSDDFYVPGAFRKIAEIFTREKCDCVYGDEYVVDEEAKVLGERLSLPEPPKKIALAFMVYGGFSPYQPAAFWTREIYEKSGGIDPDLIFAMDPDLFARFVINGSVFRYLPEHLVNFRVHESSKTHNIQHKRREERNKIRQKYGDKVFPLLRNEFLMRKLGWIYKMRHIARGNGAYFLDELLGRLNVKRKKYLPY